MGYFIYTLVFWGGILLTQALECPRNDMVLYAPLKKCFWKDKQLLTGDAAEIVCGNVNAHLATVENANVTSFVFSDVFDGNKDDVWLGINDKDQEGIWTTWDGQNLTWTDWNPNGEPDGGTQFNCVFLKWTNDEVHWSDRECDNSGRTAWTLCEANALENTTMTADQKTTEMTTAMSTQTDTTTKRTIGTTNNIPETSIDTSTNGYTENVTESTTQRETTTVQALANTTVTVDQKTTEMTTAMSTQTDTSTNGYTENVTESTTQRETTTVQGEMPTCSCCHQCTSNFTANITLDIKVMIQELEISVKSTSKYTRSKTSVMDTRASSICLGFLGTLVTLAVIGGLIIPDIVSSVRQQIQRSEKARRRKLKNLNNERFNRDQQITWHVASLSEFQ